METSNKTFMRDVTTIEREWLTELAWVSVCAWLIVGRIIMKLQRKSIIWNAIKENSETSLNSAICRLYWVRC